MKEHWRIIQLRGFSHDEKVRLLLQDMADYRDQIRGWTELANRPDKAEHRDQLYDQADMAKKQLKHVMLELAELKRSRRNGTQALYDLHQKTLQPKTPDSDISSKIPADW